MDKQTAKAKYIKCVREVNAIFSNFTPYPIPQLHFRLKKEYQNIITINKFTLEGVKNG